MTRIAAIFAALLAMPALAAANDSAAARKLPSDKYEQPRFELIERVGNIEIRRYKPMLLAEVTLEGERERAISEGFRVLAGYIFGGNQGQQNIAMTSPVTQTPATPEKIAMTSPVTQTPEDAQGKRWTVAFMMPDKYTLESLPKPNSERIRFRMTEPQTRATIRFDGISSARNLSAHREALLAFATERKLNIRGEPVVAFYDDPFTLPWNRRNEWWIAIQDPAKVAQAGAQ